MKDDNPLPSLLENIKLANKGDTSAGRWILGEFCKLVKVKKENNEPISQELEHELLNYFSGKMKSILDGEKPGTALNISKKPGGQFSKEKYERNIIIAKEVIKLMGDGNKPLFDVALELGEKYKLHESKIQDIYADFTDQAMVLLIQEKLDIS